MLSRFLEPNPMTLVVMVAKLLSLSVIKNMVLSLVKI